MAKSGLRVGEMCALRWRSVDTAHQRLVIEQAETAAGVREVDLSLDLVDEPNAWRAERKPASVDEFVFATDSGRPRDKDSVRERVLVPVVQPRQRDPPSIAGSRRCRKITPHALRRTYISLMLEAGAPLPYVMDQVGHADSKTTLEIYAQVQKRSRARTFTPRSTGCSPARTATRSPVSSSRSARLQIQVSPFARSSSPGYSASRTSSAATILPWRFWWAGSSRDEDHAGCPSPPGATARRATGGSRGGWP